MSTTGIFISKRKTQYCYTIYSDNTVEVFQEVLKRKSGGWKRVYRFVKPTKELMEALQKNYDNKLTFLV